MRLISLSELSAADLDAWRALADRALEPNPFFEPIFVLAAARAFGSDAARLLVVEGEGGEWAGCMPVAEQRRLGGALRVLGTWDHPYSFLGTPLVAGTGAERFAVELVESVAGRFHSRFLQLKKCAEGPVLDAIRAEVERQRATVVYEVPHERATLQRRPAEDYLDAISKRHRREHKRLRRRLAEEMGAEEATSRDRTGDPTAIDDFLRLETSGWKGREGTAMAAKEGDAELLRNICSGFGEQGRLQLLALEGGGRPAAMKVNVAAGDSLFCFKIAYDEELGRFSPGILLELDNVHLFHAERQEPLMDSCAQPDNQMINRLWPDRRSISRLMIGPDGPPSGLLRIARSSIRKIRRSDRN